MSIINLSDNIEKSPSGKAKCRGCGKKIGLGTPRVKQSWNYRGHTEQGYYCYICGKGHLEDDIKELENGIKAVRKMEIELKTLTKKCKGEIALTKI